MTDPVPWQEAVRQQPLTTTPEEEHPGVVRKRYARWTLWLSVLNAVLTLVVVTMILDFSEDWWLSGVLVHSPQVPWLVPSLSLLGCSLVWHFRSSLINATCFFVVLFALCGYRISLKPLAQSEPSAALVRVATCHVSDNAAAIDRVLDQLRARQVDVIALQGVNASPKLDARFFPRWKSVKEGSYWVASRWPVQRVCLVQSSSFQRTSGLNVEIEHPDGAFIVTNLELTSAATVMNELSLGAVLKGTGRQAIELQLSKREQEAVEAAQGGQFESPQLIVGDFGVHPSSKVFRRHFGHLRDAFDTAGVSFGYTAPQQGSRFWPPRVAWMRSDMILSSGHFEPMKCDVIEAPGMNHNAVFAELKRTSWSRNSN